MRHLFAFALLAAAASTPILASAQTGVTPAPDQKALLAAASPRLAANKKLVYDFWREILEAGHTELAEKYVTESYIQHNPNVPNGRQGLIDFFRKNDFAQPKPVEAKVKAPLVAIVAEGNLVTLAFASERTDPKDGRKYSTTWFDMFRIENGKIAEHWDSADIWHSDSK